MISRKKKEAIAISAIIAISAFAIFVTAASNPASAPGPASGVNVTINETGGIAIRQPNAVNFTIQFNTTNQTDISNTTWFINITPVSISGVTIAGPSPNVTINDPLNATLTDYNTTFEINGTSDVKFDVAVRNENNSLENATITGFIFDGTEPIVVANTPIGQYANNGTTLNLNASITDALSGVKNATVDVSSVNSTVGTAKLNNVSGYWTNNSIIVDTPNEGLQNLAIIAYDNATNVNNAANLTVLVDNSPPAVAIDTPTESSPIYKKGGALFFVNFTYSELYPKNYTVAIRNSTSVINSTTISSVVGGTNQFANESFNLNSTATDGNYNVTVTMYDNVSLSYTAHQNYSVVKAESSPSVVIDTPTESSPVYKKGGTLFYVNFTYSELNPKNYTVAIRDSTSIINSTTNSSVVGGTNQFANESFNLNSTAADGQYNVTVMMYNNVSLSYTAYQNYSVVNDNLEPQITSSSLQPSDGSTTTDTTPTISASYGDSGSGMSISSVIVTLDGTDVTASATVIASGVTYTPSTALSYATHTVSLSVADKATNTASKTWSFTVSSGRRGGRGVPRDSDGDGYSDVDEMLAGTNPNAPDDFPNKPETTPEPTPEPIAKPSPTVQPTAPLPAPTPTPTSEPTAATPTPEEPGFESVFAIAGLLAVAYLVRKLKK